MEPIDFPAPRSRTLADILADFRKPIPPRFISQKSTGKYKADYVHHAIIRDLLDFMAPGWEWSTKLFSVDGKVYVTGTLTIHGSDGSQTRDGIGNEDSGLDGYGDPSSNSEAQALRRAAMAHGLGRHLWKPNQSSNGTPQRRSEEGVRRRPGATG